MIGARLGVSSGQVQSRFDMEAEGGLFATRVAILKENLYGVDLDPKAVEIAQLNLMIRAAESRHRLPTLEKNIRVGNSVIDDPQVAGARAFPWNERFPEIMRGGGFDVVIGNPPYVRPHRIPPPEKSYFWRNTKTFRAKSDLYACFIERSIGLLRPKGIVSLIIPHTWTSLESFFYLRKEILENCRVNKLVQLPKKVFQDATVETCIVVLEKEPSGERRANNEVVVTRLDEGQGETEVKRFRQSEILRNHLYNFELYSESEANSIFRKLAKLPKLKSLVNFTYGLKTGDDDTFISTERRDSSSMPLLRSADISRYSSSYKGEFVWYRPELMTANKLTARPGNRERFEQPKLIMSRMGKALVGTYDSEGFFVKDCMLLAPKRTNVSLLYLLGLLNSRLLNYYYRNFFVTVDVLKNALLSLPVSKAEEVDVRRMEGLVKRALVLREDRSLRSQTALTDDARQRITDEIHALDLAIDDLVYRLYGLTAKERAIVEKDPYAS